jgi:hypothetical protein
MQAFSTEMLALWQVVTEASGSLGGRMTIQINGFAGIISGNSAPS